MLVLSPYVDLATRSTSTVVAVVLAAAAVGRLMAQSDRPTTDQSTAISV